MKTKLPYFLQPTFGLSVRNYTPLEMADLFARLDETHVCVPVYGEGYFYCSKCGEETKERALSISDFS